MEEKSILSDAVESPATDTADAVETAGAPVEEAPVSEPSEVKVTDTAKAEDTPEKSESLKSDPSARLREARETITRASYDAEVFKRRRDGGDSSSPAVRDGDDESARLAEEKKREAAVDEKRAALEYAESYRARVRRERESAATRKKEEERERIKAEEKAAREREIAEDIEREREAAKERSARTESLLERVGVDISTVPAPATEDARPSDPSAAEFFDTPATEPAVTSETPVTEPAPTPSEPTHAEAPAVEVPATATTEEDYTITVDGGTSERDLLYIEGAEACKITVGVTEPAPASTPTSVPASRIMPAPVTEPAETEYVAPESDSEPVGYSDFPAFIPAPSRAAKPVSDESKGYEEERELIRHSVESDTPAEDKAALPEYPDFEPVEAEKGGRKAKGELTEEERDMLEFARSSRKVKRGKTADERVIDEYEHAESEMREAVAVEEIDEKPAKKDKEPKKEKPKSFFDKRAAEKNKRRQIKNDELLIEHRIYDEIRRLEMDTHTGFYSFSAKIESEKERRARGRKIDELKAAKNRLAAAKKYEAADNARYYYLVTTDVENVRLPKSADRDEIKKTRDELLALLKKRDELNIKLIELYSISEGGKGRGAEGRFNAIIAAKKKMYKQQLPTYRNYERAGVSREEKVKLYALLDERTELSGELAKVNYMLKKERAKGEARKELKREKRRIIRTLEENKRAILHYEKKALKRAEKETEVNNSAIAAWVVLGILLVAVGVCVVFWDKISPWLIQALSDAVAAILGNGAE